MYKYSIILFLLFFIFSCTPQKGSENNEKAEESTLKIVKSFTELFMEMDKEFDDPFFSIGFLDETGLGRGFYNIEKDGTTNYGIGVDYMRLALIQDIYTEDSITLYFSYLRSDGTQIDNPPYYRVIVTKDEIENVINDVNKGNKKYYVIDKTREDLGQELPPELKGIELPWD